MASVNKVIIVGNLGKDPEVRTFPNGDLVANVSIATTDRWRDKNTGENREHTEWHRVSFTGRLAEIAEQYLRKGSQVYVEGSLRTRKWTDQQGVERYSTEIRADSMQMLGSPQGSGGGQRYSNDDQDQGRGGNSGGGYGGGRGGYDRGGNGGRGSNDDQRRQANDQRQYDDRGGQRSGGDNRGGQGGDRSTNGGGSRQGGQSNPPRQQQSQQQQPQRANSGFDDMDDDIPF